MSLRDLFLFGTLAALVFIVPRRPLIGGLAWVVFGVMNPHRLSWGAAYSFPFSYVIALLTLTGLLLSKQHRTIKGGAAMPVLAAFVAWMCVTTLFAFQPELAQSYLLKVVKVFLMTFVLMLLMQSRRDVELLVWTLVVSLGFYGVKGGLFVLATGGSYMVVGPDNSAMEGNNSLGVGLVVVIPLMYFLLQQSKSKWTRLGLMGAMALCAISVLGSYSRGALLAVVAMGILLWWRGRNKVVMLLGALAFVAIAIPAMPSHWTSRMETIQTYEEDSSAMGRLIAWETAHNIAKDKFPLAGGFDYVSIESSARYSPVPTVVLVAHSIYFQVIGTQGYIGLVFFLLFWWLVWRQCSWVRRESRSRTELQWAHSLASMVQVSLVGYAVGGAFLDLAFWDLPYYLVAAVSVTRYVVQGTLAAEKRPVGTAPARAEPPMAGRAPATPNLARPQ